MEVSFAYLRGRFIISEFVWALFCLAALRSIIGWPGIPPLEETDCIAEAAEAAEVVWLYLLLKSLARCWFREKLLLLWLDLLTKRCFLWLTKLFLLWLFPVTRPLPAPVLSRYLVVRFSFSFFTSDIRSPNLQRKIKSLLVKWLENFANVSLRDISHRRTAKNLRTCAIIHE